LKKTNTSFKIDKQKTLGGKSYSKINNIIEEKNLGLYEMPYSKYEQWAKYTSPHQTAEQFISRNYPIHAHYYTPESFYQIMDYLQKNVSPIIKNIFMYTIQNNKDFFILIEK
jgi:hypothetical protein